MLTIWKYGIPTDTTFTLRMPKGAQVLDVQIQRDTPQLWALVDYMRQMEDVRFFCYGTGWEIPESEARDEKDLVFINTFMSSDGGLVFHLFMEKPDGD